MLKKLYGLFIYRLQMTSYFSIMERVSGFVLLALFYYFLLLQFSFLNVSYSNFFYYLTLLVFLIVLFFLSFHIVNGFRIYLMSIYYYVNLKKQPLVLNTMYSLEILEKNNILKKLLSFFKGILNFFKIYGLQSNYFFLFSIFLIYVFIVFFSII
jgi:succinate dehydrogenase/fumarate reductase cytochrome b subunit